MGSMVAARRTDSSYPKFLASTNPSDLVVAAVHQAELLARLRPPAGPAAARGRGRGGRAAHRGHPHPEREPRHRPARARAAGRDRRRFRRPVLRPGPDDDRARTRGPIRRGRTRWWPPRTRPPLLHLHVGSRVRVGLISNSGAAASAGRADLTVVGIGVLNTQVLQDSVDSGRTGFLVGTPALAREFASCCASGMNVGLRLDGGSRYDTAVGQEYEHLLATSRYISRGGSELYVYVTSAIEARGAAGDPPGGHRARRVRADRRAGRADHRDPVHGPAAPGRGGRRRGAAGARRRAGDDHGRRAARHRGGGRGRGAARRRPWPSRCRRSRCSGRCGRWSQGAGSTSTGRCSGWGRSALVLVLGGVAAVIAYRQVPHRLAARDQAGDRRTSRGPGGGWPPGCRPRGWRACGWPWSRGGAAPRCRSARSWPAAVLAMTVVSATLTFGASLTTLVSHPALYGWNFSYALYAVQGWGQRARPVGRPAAGPRPAVAATTGVDFATVQIDGQTVPAMVAPTRPAVAPAHPVRARARQQPRTRPRPGHPGSAAPAGRRHRDAGQRQLPCPAQDRGHGHDASDRRRADRSSLDEHRGAVLHGRSPGEAGSGAFGRSCPGPTPSSSGCGPAISQAAGLRSMQAISRQLTGALNSPREQARQPAVSRSRTPSTCCRPSGRPRS